MKPQQQRIVLVEDDRDIRELLVTLLTDAGYAVMPVENGETAVTALQAAPCDLLVTDYHLPDTRGNLLIVFARAICPQIVTVLISAEPNVEYLASLCGAHAWFRKGERLDRFLATVERACAPCAVSKQSVSC